MSTQGDLKVHSPDMTSRRHYACVRDSRSFSIHIPLLPWMVSHLLWYLKETLRGCPIVNSCLVYAVAYCPLENSVSPKMIFPPRTVPFHGAVIGLFTNPALGSLPWGACIPVAEGGRDLWNPGIFKFWNLKTISSFQSTLAELLFINSLQVMLGFSLLK